MALIISLLLSQIGLGNFKTFGNEVSVNVKPITILVGPNGSGKSSILEAICLMSQSVGEGLRLDGNLVRYPNYESIFHRRDKGLPLTFHLGIDLNDDEYVEILNLSRGASLPLEPNTKKISYRYTLWFENDAPQEDQTIFFDDWILVEAKRAYRQGRNEQIVKTPYDDKKPLLVDPMPQYFLNPGSLRVQGLAGNKSEIFNKLINVAVGFFIKRLRDNVRFLMSTRGKIESTSAGTSDPDWVGPEGEFVIQIMSKIFGDRKYSDKKNKIFLFYFFIVLLELQAILCIIVLLLLELQIWDCRFICRVVWCEQTSLQF